MFQEHTQQLVSLDHPNVDYNDVIVAVHQLIRGVQTAEAAGRPRAELRRDLATARALHARSPFIRRLQEWPRGYPGDFETIEYLCEGANLAPPRSLAHALERYALNCDAAQQHRNKVIRQGRLILDAFRRFGAEARVLSLACGGSRDVAPYAQDLTRYGGTLVVNDVDPGAVALTRERLAALGENLVVVPGNGIRRYQDVAVAGPFHLVVAGGLFDYLPTPVAAGLIRAVWQSLRPGGRFFWTNMAVGNPYRAWIENLGDWSLIERSESDIHAVIAEAGIGPGVVRLAREETGLTVLVEMEKSSEELGL